MMKDLISIIVPVYNAEKTLHRCVESIISQDYINWELILIDDGSCDSSLEICKYYASIDKRIRLMSKRNGGASSARNVGLELASGEWVTFCDSDDYVEPQWLNQFMVNSPGNQLIIQGFNPIGKTDINKTSFAYNGTVFDGLLLLYMYPIPGSLCTKCLKKSIIDSCSLRFNELYRFREDEDFFLKYIRFVDVIKSIEYSGYNYVMPEFNEKYRDVDVFEPFMSIYQSLRYIYDEANYVTGMYIKELVLSIFYSYEINDHNKKHKLHRFTEYVGMKIWEVKIVPFQLRLLLSIRPTILIHYIIEVKNKINKLNLAINKGR